MCLIAGIKANTFCPGDFDVQKEIMKRALCQCYAENDSNDSDDSDEESPPKKCKLNYEELSGKLKKALY